jgi:gag-polypeptide of LTR copia-type
VIRGTTNKVTLHNKIPISKKGKRLCHNPYQKLQNHNMAQPSEKLTGIMLNGKNYHSWARQITFALTGRDKLEYVTREMPPPVPATAGAPTAEETKKLREWRKGDHLVANWLLNTMEPHIADIMSLQNTSQEIWEKAESLYSKKR